MKALENVLTAVCLKVYTVHVHVYIRVQRYAMYLHVYVHVHYYSNYIHVCILADLVTSFVMHWPRNW